MECDQVVGKDDDKPLVAFSEFYMKVDYFGVTKIGVDGSNPSVMHLMMLDNLISDGEDSAILAD